MMSEHQDFQQQFSRLDVTMRAALVFRYREGLPLSHVAQLVDRPVRKLAPLIDQALAELRDGGVLGTAVDPVVDPAVDPAADRAVAERLGELRDDPALSSFNLVRAVRAQQNQRGLLRGRLMRRFA